MRDTDPAQPCICQKLLSFEIFDYAIGLLARQAKLISELVPVSCRQLRTACCVVQAIHEPKPLLAPLLYVPRLQHETSRSFRNIDLSTDLLPRCCPKVCA